MICLYAGQETVLGSGVCSSSQVETLLRCEADGGGRRYSLEAMSTGGFGAAGLVARGRSGTAAEARDAMEAGMCKDGLAGPEAECGR